MPAPWDSVVSLPGLPCDYILDQIKRFWAQRHVYEHFKFLHKRGILMYGPPGCGKTSIIRLLVEEFIQASQGIVVEVQNFREAPQCLQDLRRLEPDRPIMTVMEDIEGTFNGEQGISQVQAALSFLDGQSQLDNIVHVATTNTPENLADRFIKRPGRFDLVIGIHAPLPETRRAYLRHVCDNKIPEDKLEELVKKTEGLGLSYLRELASTHLCLDIPLDETLARLQSNFKTKKLSSKPETKMGFEVGYHES
jgi:AAA family ATPase